MELLSGRTELQAVTRTPRECDSCSSKRYSVRLHALVVLCCSGIQELQHSCRNPAILHTQRWIPCPRVLLPNLEELFYGQNPRHPKNLFDFLPFAMITLFSPLKYVPRGTAPFWFSLYKPHSSRRSHCSLERQASIHISCFRSSSWPSCRALRMGVTQSSIQSRYPGQNTFLLLSLH